MNQIRSHIKYLYPQDASWIIADINKLVKEYQSVIKSGSFAMDEKDVVLITYADSFKSNGSSNLQTLNKMAHTYLSGLINSIHILPFYPYTSDDGFSVIDYKAVNAEFGNWNDIADLSKDFSLMFDAVINHISKSSNWFNEFLAGNPRYENFFIEENPDQPELHEVTRPRTLPLLHKFNKAGKDVYIWTTFSEDQVDINYSNPRVFLAILDVLLFYISKGAKLIRLDAIAFMWKKIGTNCIHLEETHRIIQAYRNIIEEVAPQTILITETNVPHNENISYFGNGYNEAHMVYNFTLPPLLAYSLHNATADTLTRWANSLCLPSDKTCFFNFTASHDGIGVRPLQGIISIDEINKLAQKAEKHGGFVSYKSNPDGSQSPYELNCNYMDLLTNPVEKDEIRIKRFMLTQSVMLAMPGIPAVYYHSLFGSGNDIEGAIESAINRRINRKKLCFEELQEELENENSFRSKVYREYKHLLEIRKKEKALNPNADAKFYNSNNVFAIERKYNHETIIAVHNFTSEPQNISTYLTNKLNLISTENSEYLAAYEYRWLKAV